MKISSELYKKIKDSSISYLTGTQIELIAEGYLMAKKEHEAELKAKDEQYKLIVNDVYMKKIESLKNEVALLKQCAEEAIKRPMGVEPSIYSDYKIKEML